LPMASNSATTALFSAMLLIGSAYTGEQEADLTTRSPSST
jgi:hypothetical protein